MSLELRLDAAPNKFGTGLLNRLKNCTVAFGTVITVPIQLPYVIIIFLHFFLQLNIFILQTLHDHEIFLVYGS